MSAREKSWGETCRFIWPPVLTEARSALVLDPVTLLLYRLGMPAQVIVVTRPRRSLFAIPRALPDWLRSLWAALFRSAAQPGGHASLDPLGARVRSLDEPLFPQLVLDDHGSHLCIGCELCVRVCPAHCLSIATEDEGVEVRRVTRFALTSGACIGCSTCAEACPEDAIQMTPSDDRVALAPLVGGSDVVDLLSDPSRLQI